jgi:branched-chain amino acid transport system ATP-binding protein
MPALEIIDLHAGYGPIHVLRGLGMRAETGGITVVLGSNGAGKTTTLRTIMGTTNVYSGKIRVDGVDIAGWTPRRCIRERGLAIVPEGRQLFPELTVQENLIMGAYGTAMSSVDIRARIRELAGLLPVVELKLQHRANTLSGGEQQIVSIARALMSRPKLILADEVSQGVAPILTLQLWEIFRKVAHAGTSVVLVEQNVAAALRIADWVVLLQDGKTVDEGTREHFASNEHVLRAYLS